MHAMTTLGEFEDFTSLEMRKRIVDSVFESIDLLSKEARDSIKDAVGPIDGFRPGKDVPKGMLRAECHKLSKKLDFFSMVIMPVWAEANPDLQKLVANHMKGCPPPPDADKKALDEYSAEQAETLARLHDQYDREDLLIMVRYCTADTDSSLFDDADQGESDSPYMGVTGIGTTQFLMWLESLPADAAEWYDLVPRFASALTEMMSRKGEERSAIVAFASILTDIKAAHAETLTFFQADTSDWAASKIAWVEAKDALRQQADSLKQTLEEYSVASRPGSNLAEERKRREQRENLERAIESRINRVNELLQDAKHPDDSLRSMTLRDFILGLEEIANDVIGGESVSDGEDDPEDGTGEDYAHEKRKLEETLAGLENENRGLEDEVRRLQQQVTLWRSNYETERRSKDDSEPDPIPTEFTSVAHALEIAERRFADRLVFKFNSASEPDYPYDTPADVWNALEWLATAYYDSHTGKISIPNLSDSLREVSRFRYTPHQSGTTIGMYPDSYYTRINGHKVLLKEHMGAGIDRSPTNSIRIAFNWDKQSGKVIVGYIGLHQHNRKT